MDRLQQDTVALTPETACAALRAAGLRLHPPMCASSAATIAGPSRFRAIASPGFPPMRRRQQLSIERRVLRLLVERCTFAAPRILFESPNGFDIRAIVPGRTDPWGVFAEAREEAALARRLGHALGNILVEQHTRITRADVAGWLPERVNWPEPSEWILGRVVEVTDDRALIAAIEGTLAIYERVEVDPADRVLVHGDLGFHNVAVDPATTDVRGVFGYSGTAWADRHHDRLSRVLLA